MVLRGDSDSLPALSSAALPLQEVLSDSEPGNLSGLLYQSVFQVFPDYDSECQYDYLCL